jgi:arginine/serine-rich splicing factor 4/5/6
MRAAFLSRISTEIFLDKGLILEYLSREDADRAVKDLDGKDLRGRSVRVLFDDNNRAGPDNYRRDDRRDDRHREFREDRNYRRERSRSPPRRSARSPPPRREVDDRRPAGDDRREDRRRDEKEERYDERPSRHANGDGGWSR